jgi:hypothetical protein
VNFLTLLFAEDAGNFFVTTMESNLQLHDLSVDPSESKNLVGSKPEVAKELAGKVVDWHRSITN